MTDGFKLFIVEFGDPDTPGWSSFGCTNPIYVIAFDYNEAAKKAIEWTEKKREKRDDVVVSDGSINQIYLKQDKSLSVKAVKIASNDVIF